MMEEMARVIACDDKGWLTVEVELKSSCKSCSSGDSCGTSAVAQAFSSKTQQFAIYSERPCQPGELLKLGLPESTILKAAGWMYLMPLLGLFVGAILGQWLGALMAWDTDIGAIVFAVLGALATWFAGRYYLKRLEVDAQPVILAYLGMGVGVEKITY
ncbi:MAG: SoxR reducing system RseC family protein [Shewanella sp.]